MGRTRPHTFTLALCAVALAASARSSSADDTSICDPSSTTCRTMVIANNCAQTVWIGTLGDAVACAVDADCPTATSTCDATAHVCTCTTTADCAAGTQVCDTVASPVQCAYAQPLKGGQMLASGASETTYVPSHSPGTSTTSWGGRFWARTGCPDFTTCGVTGAFCTSASDCCTNAGCIGNLTCQSNSECNTWDCTTNDDCKGGATCDTTVGKCNACAASQCTCRNDADCNGGGGCQDGVCTGRCNAGGLACQTGDCDTVLGCPVGVSGQAPTTLAEFTLLSGAANYDTYDVSQVNGFNVPVKIAPTLNVRTSPKTSGNLEPWCGSPGCTSATECPGQASACGWTGEFANCLCDWNVDASSCPDPMRAVWPVACSSDSDCSPGVCDTSTVPNVCICSTDADCPGSAPTCGVNSNITLHKRVCGNYVGCVAMDDACTSATRLRGKEPPRYNCKKQDFLDLYGCTGNNGSSCYTVGSDSSCCGCPSWSLGGNAGPFPETGSCQSSNPRWTRLVEPFVATFKNSCPTAYSFEYDDPTSTFNCSGTGPQTPVGYTVTFCPCGSPGALSCS